MRGSIGTTARRVLVPLALAGAMAVAGAMPAGAVATHEFASATLVARGAGAQVTYTVTCDEGFIVNANFGVNQRSGDALASGSSYASATCTGAPQPLSALLIASGAPFRAGVAIFSANVEFCTEFGGCGGHTLTQEVHRITRR